MSVNLMTDAVRTSQHMHGFHMTSALENSLPETACFEGNRRSRHAVAKEMPFSNADTGLLLLLLNS